MPLKSCLLSAALAACALSLGGCVADDGYDDGYRPYDGGYRRYDDGYRRGPDPFYGDRYGRRYDRDGGYDRRDRYDRYDRRDDARRFDRDEGGRGGRVARGERQGDFDRVGPPRDRPPERGRADKVYRITDPNDPRLRSTCRLLPDTPICLQR